MQLTNEVANTNDKLKRNRTLNRLDVKTIEASKPKNELYRLYDGGGLFVEICPNGSKRWRFKYHIDGKDNNISLGIYPAITLKMAREKRNEMRKLVDTKIDPSESRKTTKQTDVEKTQNTFEFIAREWHDKHIAKQMAESHRHKVMRGFERDVFPWLGKKSIDEIDASEILSVLRRIEARGALETAHRILNNISRVFRYARSTARAKYNPCPDLKGALPHLKTKHRSAIIEPQRTGELLRAIYGYQGTLTVQCALKLAPLLFVRPGELRTMEWKDIDFKSAEWSFKSSKKEKPLIVPLATQSLAILREIYPLTGFGRFVFPNMRSNDRAMSDNAILSALRRLEIPKDEMCGHGFRAMARTLLAERLKISREIIMLQLTHQVLDPLGEAYERTSFISERKQMMQKWADYLDELRSVSSSHPINI